MSWSREKAAALWPIIQAYGEGRTIQAKRFDDNWNDVGCPSFDVAAKYYRIKPDETFVAGQDLEECSYAVVVNGVAKPCDDDTGLKVGLFVPYHIRSGTRLLIEPREDDEIRDKLVAAPEEVCEGNCQSTPEPAEPVSAGNWVLTKQIRKARSKPEVSEQASGQIVAGEDIPAVHAEIVNGKAFARNSMFADGSILYVPEPLTKGERVKVVKSTESGLRDTLVRDTQPQPEVSVANQDGHDEVNNPSHYQDESGYECIQFAELLDDGRLFNVMKYLWRVGLKQESPKDLEKAVWYLRRYLAGGSEDANPNTLDISNVICHRPWPIAEAMRLIWETTRNVYWHQDEEVLQKALHILEAEIDRRKAEIK